MRVLLDTHVWLWMLTTPERLGDALAVVEETDNELLLSAATSWEISIKHSIGRLVLPRPPATFVPASIRSTGVTPLAVQHIHALEVAALPMHHRDPFDRLIIAQAIVERVPVISADRAFGDYGIDVIPV